MFQKRNDFEIVALLQKEPTHLRALSNQLKIPPTTTMRVLHSLVEENVIDFKEIGKNKQFFLKDSSERKIYENFAEHYLKLKLIQEPMIRHLVHQIISKTKNNELVILFGSYAKGIHSQKSDIDIYVETNNQNLKKEIEQISHKLSVKIGSFDKNSLLVKEIIQNHIILQNVERFLYLRQ